MENIKTAEMFSNGLKALDSKDYLKAEQLFLSVIYEYSQNQQDYLHDMGSRTQLADLYSQGLGPDKERATAFLEIFVEADSYVHEVFNDAHKNGIVSKLLKGDFVYHKKSIDAARIEFFSTEKFRPKEIRQ